MLFELKKITEIDKHAIMGAIKEYKDKDKDSIPRAFAYEGDIEDEFTFFMDRFKQPIYANCVEECLGYVCNNTKAIVGFAAIRKYNDADNAERQRIGDIEIGIRPSHRRCGWGRQLFTDVLSRCADLGMSTVLFRVLVDNAAINKMLESFDVTELSHDSKSTLFELSVGKIQ